MLSNLGILTIWKWITLSNVLQSQSPFTLTTLYLKVYLLPNLLSDLGMFTIHKMYQIVTGSAKSVSCLALSLSLSHSLTHSLAHSLTHSLSLSHSHTHTKATIQVSIEAVNGDSLNLHLGVVGVGTDRVIM